MCKAWTFYLRLWARPSFLSMFGFIAFFSNYFHVLFWPSSQPFSSTHYLRWILYCLYFNLYLKFRWRNLLCNYEEVLNTKTTLRLGTLTRLRSFSASFSSPSWLLSFHKYKEIRSLFNRLILYLGYSWHSDRYIWTAILQRMLQSCWRIDGHDGSHQQLH